MARGLARLRSPVVLAAGVGYLLGTLPSADIVSQVASRGQLDLRRLGSGNPGAANAAAQLGTSWGLVVRFLDMAKGAGAGVIGRAIAGDNGGYAASTASIAGHIAPVWSRFRGGKGVATSAGACLAVFPAYFPIDATVTALTATRVRNAERTVQLASAAWVGASLAWWRFRLPNGWGPAPTAGLPISAAVGAGLLFAAFERGHRKPST